MGVDKYPFPRALSRPGARPNTAELLDQYGRLVRRGDKVDWITQDITCDVIDVAPVFDASVPPGYVKVHLVAHITNLVPGGKLTPKLVKVMDVGEREVGDPLAPKKAEQDTPPPAGTDTPPLVTP